MTDRIRKEQDMDNYFVNYLLAQDGAENSVTASILHEAYELQASEETNKVEASEEETDEPVYVGLRRQQ